jgi:hypothetical protein
MELLLLKAYETNKAMFILNMAFSHAFKGEPRYW